MNKKVGLWLIYLVLVVITVFIAINYGDSKAAYHEVADKYTTHPDYPDDIPKDLQDELNQAWKDYYITATLGIWAAGILHVILIGRYLFKYFRRAKSGDSN